MDQASPRSARRQFVIVEGPAGSGKSQLTRELESRFPVVRSSLLKRAFEVEEAVVHSSLNDFAKIQAAIDFSRKSPVVIIERLGMSQLVYGQMRMFDADERSLYKISSMMMAQHIQYMFQVVWTDLAVRSLYKYDPQPVTPVFDILWLFLIPTVGLLAERRESGCKVYPWSAEREIQQYTLAANQLPYPHLVVKYGYPFDKERIEEFIAI